MSDRPTDDGKPESWQGNSPNGSNAGSFAPLAPSLPQTVRLAGVALLLSLPPSLKR